MLPEVLGEHVARTRPDSKGVRHVVVSSLLFGRKKKERKGVSGPDYEK